MDIKTNDIVTEMRNSNKELRDSDKELREYVDRRFQETHRSLLISAAAMAIATFIIVTTLSVTIRALFELIKTVI